MWLLCCTCEVWALSNKAAKAARYMGARNHRGYFDVVFGTIALRKLLSLADQLVTQWKRLTKHLPGDV